MSSNVHTFPGRRQSRNPATPGLLINREDTETQPFNREGAWKVQAIDGSWGLF